VIGFQHDFHVCLYIHKKKFIIMGLNGICSDDTLAVMLFCAEKSCQKVDH
jgi:hypothetical protein